jgi:peptidoglycan biosynthesis protein MviN/MurJ (putative lipid II flippase)
MVPVALLFMLASEQLFSLIFSLSKKATLDQVMQAKWILVIYCAGLVFFSFNKTLLSLFYSLKDTTSATKASAVAAIINVSVDLISLYFNSIYGIAAATVAAGVGMTAVSLYFLHTKHHIYFYASRYVKFLSRLSCQLGAGAALFALTFYGPEQVVRLISPHNWLLNAFGFWVRFGAASMICAYWYYSTRKFFSIRLHFID